MSICKSLTKDADLEFVILKMFFNLRSLQTMDANFAFCIRKARRGVPH